MNHMRELHSSLCWNGYACKPQRIIEDPDSEQAGILGALGYKIDCGVLQPTGA